MLFKELNFFPALKYLNLRTKCFTKTLTIKKYSIKMLDILQNESSIKISIKEEKKINKILWLQNVKIGIDLDRLSHTSKTLLNFKSNQLLSIFIY